jgi:putative addiction module killer protein
MNEIRRTSAFIKWFKKMKDRTGKALISMRIERLEAGNPGDAKSIGEGCSEMRIDYGPGYRVYYKDTGKEIIVLLCDGDKSAQQEDIAKAKLIAASYVLEDKE